MMGRLRLFQCFGGGAADKGQTVDDTAGRDNQRAGDGGGVAVLVELFSSQGCKTSPEAELLLSRLGRGDFMLDVQVVVLSFHVDYWDYLGWKDPFASSLWTVRQKAYVQNLGLDTLYTPQVVIQGRDQCIGTDQDALLSAIQTAARFPTPTFQVTFQRPKEEALQVCVTGALRNKVDGKGADVVVALYESGLVTDCDKGENKGRVLSNNYVVRGLEKLCSLKDMSAKRSITGNVTMSLWDGFNSSKCGLVVFIQTASSQTLGAQHFVLPSDL